MENNGKQIKDDLATYLGDTAPLALFLEADTTIRPDVSHPSDAIFPTGTKAAITNLSIRPDVRFAIVSGNTIEDLKKKIRMDGITYAGSHGMEILLHDGVKFDWDPAHPKRLGWLNDKAEDLAKKLRTKCGKKGAWVETKGAFLTFHFGFVKDKFKKSILEQAMAVIKEDQFEFEDVYEPDLDNLGFDSSYALKSWPKGSWHKGEAVNKIMTHDFREDWADKAKVIYIGVDVTDEDTMKNLNGTSATFHVTGNNNIDTSENTDLLNLLKLIEEHMKQRDQAEE